MKKGIGYIFLAGILFGMMGYFAAKYYLTEQARSQLEALNLIVSVEDFVSRISFYDGTGITMEDADMFYYDYVDTSVPSVLMFSAREFYSLYARDQEELEAAIEFLKKTKKLNGVTISKKATVVEMKIHNALHKGDADHENTFSKIKNSLEEKLKRSQISITEMETLRYIYTLGGEYPEMESLSQKICKKSRERCNDQDVLVTGTVLDPIGRPIENATIMALNYPALGKAITKEDGTFEFKLKVGALDKIRLRAVKRGYSDGFQALYVYHSKEVVLEEPLIKKEANFVLNQSHAVVLLDLDNRTLELKKKGIIKSVNFKDNQFHLWTKNNTYHIPVSSFIDKDEKPRSRGTVELHLYEFDRGSANDIGDLVLLDISSEDGNRLFLGGFLQTFGMPYMQFFTKAGEELFVGKENPIDMSYQIVEMGELTDREDYPVTEEELERLVQLSTELGGYPLTREFLIENELSHMPPWWMLNRKKGIWENVPFRLKNKEGLLESIFYSYNS